MRQIEANLMYVHHTGMGYAAMTPQAIAAMDVDDIQWHQNRLFELLNDEVEAINRARREG